MSGLPGSPASPMEERLSGAYSRIVKLALVLSAIATITATLLAGWRNGLGVALGAFIAFVNFVWLHHGAEVLVRRMLSAGQNGPAKLWVMLSFPLRYVLVIAAVYAILKGYPGVLVAFIVGLALPLLASVGEGVYEAFAFGRKDRTLE